MEKHIKIDNLDAKIYLPTKNIKEVVIGVHGFSGDKESSVLLALSKKLTANNIVLITFDLPCHGENDNSNPLDLNSCIQSFGKVLDYAKTTYPSTSISIFRNNLWRILNTSLLIKPQRETQQSNLACTSCLYEQSFRGEYFTF